MDLELIADEIIANIQKDVDYFRRCAFGKCGDFKYNSLLPILKRIALERTFPIEKTIV